ncbi:hypothetical protein [Antrihabitans sp. YC2-6]|uniref:hypothetical protein n=1 Tax=Antrihabitans sp. YC2-6 TaxID=2799498 RepID=UPI0018F430F3|nr:hypothetical protein [Antrihabitans sp. YC2-6]MBJ8348666.1 hypothetical protein [Antrihabitans sp. YC2-6]
MHGPDLPPADMPFDIDSFVHRWPTAVEKSELVDGRVLLFTGIFDERDAVIARHTYPGRIVLVNQGGSPEVRPGGDSTDPQSVVDRYRTDSR